MAWLQQNPSGHFYIGFRFAGRTYRRSLKTTDRKQATSKKVRLEDTIALIESGRIEVPTGIDVPTYLLTEGAKNGKTVIRDCRLDQLLEKFFDAIPEGSLESTSIKTMKTHQNHLLRILGRHRYVGNLSNADLQSYIQKRSQEKGIRGRNISATTIRKEVTTLRSVWNWAIEFGELERRSFPSKGLRYPKVPELPPFQTFEEVLAKTAGLDPGSAKAKDLWSTVFLDRSEVEELLDAVQSNQRLPAFVYPMFCIAAHTGARRSEIRRAMPEDIGKSVLTIRERKRRRGKLSLRTVPMSQRLQMALSDWLGIRPPSGDGLFCHVVESRCFTPEAEPITENVIDNQFERAVQSTRFQYLIGWHVLRHSFCSNCAAAGIDQRMIDAWVGHTTEEMRRRYRHMFPSKEKQALELVYG